MSFDDLGLSKKVLAAVEASGYTEPTPIQAQAIPHVMQHRDVLGIAQTGTGKTASFTLPMLSLLEKGRARARMPRTLILEPTRELAAQVEENLNKYSQNHKLTVALLIGGTSFEEQFKKLDRGADILIATPGRLLDCFDRGKILMTGVEVLVIDEADRMLDMGFIPDIEKICKMVPFTRQTLFFSATMPPEIERLANQFLQNPVQVTVARASSTSETITQYAVASEIEDWEKRALLRKLIDDAEELKNGIVFCNRKRDVANLWKSLDRHGYSAGALHGDMDQTSRTATLKAFKDNKISLLIASDVAARGLDIPDVSHVFNFDVPVNAEDYVHRIGRTGRAGRKGTAYMVVTPEEQKGFEAIEKLIDKEIDWLGDKVEWDERAGKKRRGKKGKSDRPEKSRSKAPKQANEAEEARPRNRRGKDIIPEIDHSDATHAFGGEEHVPAFLLNAG
ncbi:MAG: DEAD/DEAH box helicase [Rhizobiaceae bacterium]|nr:DEAD/DEAH box helicase [Rhizobiaceae bacterium]